MTGHARKRNYKQSSSAHATRVIACRTRGSEKIPIAWSVGLLNAATTKHAI
jgi:hypothetical protein